MLTRNVSPLNLNVVSLHHHGSVWQLRALFQDDKERHHPDIVALQHVPFGSALVHFRMPTLQAQDVPALHIQGIACGRTQGQSWCDISPNQSIADADTQVFRSGYDDLSLGLLEKGQLVQRSTRQGCTAGASLASTLPAAE
jgi:hypothetical protein